MNPTTVLALLLVGVASFAEVVQGENYPELGRSATHCTPSATFQKDCNTCTCNQDGTAAVCTLKACPSHSNRALATEEESTRARRSASHCTPGATFQKDCNTCTCNQDGTAAVCTLKACLSHSNRELATEEESTRARRSAAHCTPGATFQKDCNTCTCNQDGTAAVCTLKACLSHSNRELATEEESTRARRSASHCTPGATFQKDCNTCTCNQDGTAAVCTLKACPSRSSREVSCTPGATYKEDCNTCRCRSDGKSGACTRRACPAGES